MRNRDGVAELLGGSTVIGTLPSTDLDFVKLIRKGLPVRAMASAIRQLQVKEEQLYAWLRISKRTAARRKSKGERLRPVESERLLRLAFAAAAATEVLGSRARAVSWLQKANRALGGAFPMDLLDTDVGFQSVMDILARIDHGVFS